MDDPKIYYLKASRPDPGAKLGYAACGNTEPGWWRFFRFVGGNGAVDQQEVAVQLDPGDAIVKQTVAKFCGGDIALFFYLSSAA